MMSIAGVGTAAGLRQLMDSLTNKPAPTSPPPKPPVTPVVPAPAPKPTK